MMTRNEKIGVGLGLAAVAGLALYLASRKPVSGGVVYWQEQEGPWHDPVGVPEEVGTVVIVFNKNAIASRLYTYSKWPYAPGYGWAYVQLEPYD